MTEADREDLALLGRADKDDGWLALHAVCRQAEPAPRLAAVERAIGSEWIRLADVVPVTDGKTGYLFLIRYFRLTPDGRKRLAALEREKGAA